MKPKCTKCTSDLHLIASGYMRYSIKHDGTRGYMFMGQPDRKDEFLICSNVKCNTRFEIRRTGEGLIFRGSVLN